MSFASMLGALVTARIQFVVVGGVAGSAHGSTHVTNHLDICYDGRPANLECLAALLSNWNAHPREVEAGLPFFMDARTLRGNSILTLQTADGAIDLLDRIAGVGDYADVRARSERVSAFGVSFRILDLPSLILARRAAGRPKDIAKLPELEALRALRALDEENDAR